MDLDKKVSVKLAKNMPFASDGINIAMAEAGTEISVRLGAVAGLINDGSIAPSYSALIAGIEHGAPVIFNTSSEADSAKAKADEVAKLKEAEAAKAKADADAAALNAKLSAVTIPDKWDELKAAEKREIADQLTKEPTKNVQEAEDAIRAELARRAAA
jgi:hypothetical protein